jgi:hypothetical protein
MASTKAMLRASSNFLALPTPFSETLVTSPASSLIGCVAHPVKKKPANEAPRMNKEKKSQRTLRFMGTPPHILSLTNTYIKNNRPCE